MAILEFITSWRESLNLKQLHVHIGPPWNAKFDGRQMLLVDDGVQNRILIFCTIENLTLCGLP